MRRHGFTILEGMVAMVLLAIVLLGVAPVYYYGTRTSVRSALRRQATQAVAGVLEQSLATGYAQIQNTSETVTAGDRSFTVEVTVNAGYASGLKQVIATCNVAWPSGGGETITLTTLISEAGHGT
jgi:prepilin-type N-terminal cleavage/methylation domain-containing protein